MRDFLDNPEIKEPVKAMEDLQKLENNFQMFMMKPATSKWTLCRQVKRD